MAMDSLFVQRAGVNENTSRGGSNAPVATREKARKMVEDMAREFALDEELEMDFSSPDERRIRSGADEGLSCARKDRVPASAAPVSSGAGAAGGAGAQVDFLFARRGGSDLSDEKVGAAAQPPTVADSLFARPAAPAEIRGVDLLFAARGESFGSDSGAADQDSEDELEIEPSIAKGSAAASKASSNISLRSCCSYLGSSCLGTLKDKRALLSYVTIAAVSLAFLAVVTGGLAMGCDEEAPLGSFCVSDGPLQWIVAFTPIAVIISSVAWYYRRQYVGQKKLKELIWQHDPEAQRTAVEILDALVAAPAAERMKYLKQTVQILKDFPDKALIQQKGCLALEAICRAARGNAVNVVSAGAVPLLLLALEKHIRVRAVQRAALTTISCVGKVGKQQMRDLGGIPIVIASMVKFKRDAAVQVSGAMTMGSLCLSADHNLRSVGKYGGMTVLLAAIERHAGRSDVVIAACETLILLLKGDSALRKQMVSSLNVVQGILARYEELLNTCSSKQQKECELVLRSLRKLETCACEKISVVPDDASDCSEVGTPRMEGQEGVKTMKTNAQQAIDLQQRSQQWKTKKGKGR